MSEINPVTGLGLWLTNRAVAMDETQTKPFNRERPLSPTSSTSPATMGTVVEQPRSALNDMPMPMPVQRRRASIVEVIDVDSLDERSNVSSRSASRPQGGNQPSSSGVIVIDSDDDDSFLSHRLPSRSSRTATRPGLSLRFKATSDTKMTPIQSTGGILFLLLPLHRIGPSRPCPAFLRDLPT